MTAMSVIGCKLPCGLVLRLYKPQEYREPLMGGGERTSTRYVWHEADGQYVLKGNAINMAPDAVRPILYGNAALTQVPTDFAEAWFAANKDTDLVKNRQVFMHKSDTQGMAKDLVSIKSGLEPLCANYEASDIDPRARTLGGPQIMKSKDS
jgi:hypothetical protein